jgi:hypothetical protein
MRRGLRLETLSFEISNLKNSKSLCVPSKRRASAVGLTRFKLKIEQTLNTNGKTLRARAEVLNSPLPGHVGASG